MNKYSPSKLIDLKSYLNQKNYKKIFILVGNKSFKKLEIKNQIEKYLLDKTIYYYEKKQPYPEYNELIEITKKLDEYNPDLIIAIGGGSVIDYAKIANILKLDENLKSKIRLNKIKFNKKYNLLAIPTTAGSGAEVTANAVIYIDKIKYSLESENIKPDYFFLIPELINIGTKKIKASAGFDAISQSIESLISTKSNSESVFFAKKSLIISVNNYLDYINKPNLDNAFKMSVAANLSGNAISISKTTAPHAVSYPFTSLFDVSHGHAVALNLTKFLKFNYKNIAHSVCDFSLLDRFNLIFEITKTKNINELSALLNSLAKKTQMELSFNNLGINIESDLEKILNGVNDMRLKNNPIQITKKDLPKIILN